MLVFIEARDGQNYILELFWLSLRNRCEGGQRMSRQVVEESVNWSKQ